MSYYPPQGLFGSSSSVTLALTSSAQAAHPKTAVTILRHVFPAILASIALEPKADLDEQAPPPAFQGGQSYGPGPGYGGGYPQQPPPQTIYVYASKPRVGTHLAKGTLTGNNSPRRTIVASACPAWLECAVAAAWKVRYDHRVPKSTLIFLDLECL